MAASAYFQDVQKLYIAYYHRPADPAGLLYWAQQIDAAGGDTTGAVNAFGMAAESQALYGAVTSATIGDVVDKIYMAAFNRLAEQAGKDYWVAQFNAGAITPAGIAVAVIAGAQGGDLTVLNAKLAVANEFTKQVDGRPLTDPAFGVAPFNVTYDGNTDADNARAILKPVSDTVTLTPAQVTQALKDKIADPGDPINSQLFQLTTGTDKFTGGAADDTFTGAVSALTSENTLNASDELDGGAGTDTLKADLKSNFTGFSGTGKLVNVENVELTNSSTIGRTFDASGVTGVQKYIIDATKAGVSLIDLDKTVAVSISNQASGTFTTAFATGAAEVLGTADAMSLQLANIGKVDDAATVADEEVAVAVTLGNIETANVEVTGNNVVTFGGTAMKTLNVVGAGNIKVNTVPTSLTAFDGSAATGNIVADVTATTSTLTTLATGAGNDKLSFDTADAAANATLSGGAGSDELLLTSGAKTVQYTMSGFETLKLDAVTGALVFSGTNVTDLTTVTTDKDNTAKSSLVNMGAGALAVKALGATVDAGDVESDHAGATTFDYVADAASVTAKTAQTTAADFTFANTSELNVNVGQYIDTTGSDITAAKAASVTLNVASGKDGSATPAEVTEFDGVITAAKASSITVNAQGKLGTNASIVAAEAAGATVTNGSTAGDLILTTAKLENLNVSTGAVLDFTGSTLSALQTLTVDAAAGLTTLGDLAKVANVTLSGAGTATGKLSAVTLGNLGGANDYNLSLTATGLKGGLTVGTLNVNPGFDVTADVAGVTGNVVLQTIGAATVGTNVTVNAKNVGGTVALGNTKGTGNVKVEAGGAIGKVTVGTLQGNNVTLDVGNTIGGFAGASGGNGILDTITAKTSATVKASSLQANTIDINADTGSTALTVALTGGILVDTVTIDGVTTSTSINVTGDLGLGADDVTLTSNATTDTSISLANLLNYETATIGGAAGHKNTISGGVGADTITGGSVVDTINAGAGKDVITGGAGDDVITGGAGADTFILGTVTAAGTDAIKDFTVADGDIIKTGAAFVTNALAVVDKGTLTGADLATVVGTFASGQANATEALKAYTFTYGTDKYLLIDNGTDGYLAGTDSLVKITGIVGDLTTDQIFNA